MRTWTVLILGFAFLAFAEGRDGPSVGFLAQRAEGDALAKVPSVDPEGLNVVVYRHKSYGQVVLEAFGKALLGVFLVILGFPVLYFNEKRQVHMDKIFDYASHVCKQNVPSDKVDSQYEANLVHVQGTTATQETLRDGEFPITVTSCAKLRRSVEMYQWVESSSTETRDAPGGGKDEITTYSYSKSWRSSPQDSSSFQEAGHDNPPMPFEGANYTASNVSLGSFSLTETLIGQMNNFQALSNQELAPQASAGGRQFSLGGTTYTSFQGSPSIGDMKVSFTKVECKQATVLSVQHDGSFAPLTYDMVPQTGCCSFAALPQKVELGANQSLLGGSKSAPMGLCSCVGDVIATRECLDDLAEETLSAREMMDRARSRQQCVHSVLKLVGYLLFFCGWLLQFWFVPTLFRVIPFIGLWIQAFGNFFAYLGAFFMGTFCYCVTVACAWLALRPVKGALFLGLAAALIVVPSVYAGQA